jgi:hypothetical protein
VIGSRGVSVDMAEEGEQDQSHEDQSTRAQLLLGQAPTLLRLNRYFVAYLISGFGGVVKVLETGVGVLASTCSGSPSAFDRSSQRDIRCTVPCQDTLDIFLFHTPSRKA